MTITEFKIKKLWGVNSYNIKIKNNKLILVAENGEGKTIILRLIYYFLSKQWDKLSEYDFDSISAIIDDKEYEVIHGNLSNNISSSQLKKISSRYPIYSDFILGKGDFQNKGLTKLLEENTLSELKNPIKINIYAEQNSIPDTIFETIIQTVNDFKFSQINFDFNIPILFLPTYRRIEQDFDKIFKNFNYSKKIERNKTIKKEKNNTEDEFDFIKIWNEILSERWKENNKTLELAEFGLKDIIAKLSFGKYDIIGLENFTTKCNSFLVNKKFVFENSEIKVKLNNNENKYELNKENIFSSGEKQIISIFFYLYLNEQEYFVIFDEPELSISINWQERLLEELSEACTGYVVATHSHSIVTEIQENYLFSIDDILE